MDHPKTEPPDKNPFRQVHKKALERRSQLNQSAAKRRQKEEADLRNAPRDGDIREDQPISDDTDDVKGE